MWWVNLGVTLIGTLIGVLLAFSLNRLWERYQSKMLYGRELSACRYDLSHVHANGKAVSGQIASGKAIILDVDAPGLRALLASPRLHQHAAHGFTVVLTSLSGFIATISNMVEHFRQVASLRQPLSEDAIRDARGRMDQLVRVIEYTQGELDKELKRLRVGVRKTAEDEEVIKGFNRALAR